MGKTTLYHPVSLLVIRGAAAFGGYRLGKLRQLAVDTQHGYAIYTTPLLHVPLDIVDLSLEQIANHFQSLFASDVEVLELSHSLRKGWNVVISTGNTGIPSFAAENALIREVSGNGY